MIANVAHNTGGKAGIAKYIRYLLSPKKTAGIKKSSDTERVMAFKCSDGRKSPSTKEELRATVTAITEQIIEHNVKYKREKKWKGDKYAIVGEISFALKDSHLTPEDAMLIVEQNLRNTMGGSREYVMVCHADSQCLHVHFVVSTVDAITGKDYHPSNVKQALTGLTYQRQMMDDWELELERTELAYGLERVIPRDGVARLEERIAHANGKLDFVSDRWVNVKQISSKAYQKLKRGLEVADIPELDLRSQFLLAYNESGGDGKDFDTLLDNLEARGIRVVPNMGTEQVRGLAIGFEHEPIEHSVALSTYGTKYGWKKLSKDFNYDPQQHRQRLADLRTEANTRATANASNADSLTTGTPLQDIDPTNSTVANAARITTTAGLGAIEGPTNGVDKRIEETDLGGVETERDNSIDHGNSNAPGQLDTSHQRVDHRSQHADGGNIESHTHSGSRGQVDEANKASPQGSDSRATQEPHTVELHRGGGTDNTDVLTGVSNPHLAAEQRDPADVVLPNDTTDAEHQRLLQEVRNALGDPPLTDAEIEAMMEEAEGLVNAPSTINNPHVNEWHFGDDDHKKAINTSIEI